MGNPSIDVNYDINVVSVTFYIDLNIHLIAVPYGSGGGGGSGSGGFNQAGARRF